MLALFSSANCGSVTGKISEDLRRASGMLVVSDLIRDQIIT